MTIGSTFVVLALGDALALVLVVLFVLLGLMGDIWCWNHQPCPKCGKRINVKEKHPRREKGVIGQICPSCDAWSSDADWAAHEIVEDY